MPDQNEMHFFLERVFFFVVLFILLVKLNTAIKIHNNIHY